MSYRRWLIVVALTGPMVAQAQRGGGGGGGRGGLSGIDDNAPPADHGIKSRDIEKLNPATMLLAKSKDLKLDDGQRTQLTEIAKRYDWNANVFSRTADSLQTLVDSRGPTSGRGRGQGGGRSARGADTTLSGDKIMAARRLLSATLVNIRSEYDTAAARSITALTDAQRGKARSMLDKPLRDLTDLLRKAGGP